jgi:preprotein translocase subunit SecB
MDLITSPGLDFTEFQITNTTLLCIYPDDKKRISLKGIKLDCDFEILTAEIDKNKMDFLINFNVKSIDEKKPGYYFDIGALGKFTLKGIHEFDENLEQQYVLFTALPMVINSVRTYLQTATSMHVFGPYLLPTIDLAKLIESKSNDSFQIEE